jgi:glyoxylase-like metal-dependent hydrolase (beta-lactamase superfamily II)
MIFRQIFDSVSSTYTYLIASRRGGEALIIDPVLDKVDRYLRLLAELDLKLIKALDTHIHADHITGLGALRDRTRCITVMGEQSGVDVVSMRVSEGDKIEIEGLCLEAIYTPGHTDDSYSFLMGDRVFTGDTLLIRGTGRTDFQNGDPVAQCDSIFGKLLKLPEETLVYPAHDYKGDTVWRCRPTSRSACLSMVSRRAAGHFPAIGLDSWLARMTWSWLTCATRPSASATASSPIRSTRLIQSWKRTSGRAGCCTNWPSRPASVWSSIAPSVSVQPWRWSTPKRPA